MIKWFAHSFLFAHAWFVHLLKFQGIYWLEFFTIIFFFSQAQLLCISNRNQQRRFLKEDLKKKEYLIEIKWFRLKLNGNTIFRICFYYKKKIETKKIFENRKILGKYFCIFKSKIENIFLLNCWTCLDMSEFLTWNFCCFVTITSDYVKLLITHKMGNLEFVNHFFFVEMLNFKLHIYQKIIVKVLKQKHSLNMKRSKKKILHLRCNWNVLNIFQPGWFNNLSSLVLLLGSSEYALNKSTFHPSKKCISVYYLTCVFSSTTHLPTPFSNLRSHSKHLVVTLGKCVMRIRTKVCVFSKKNAVSCICCSYALQCIYSDSFTFR